MTYIRPNVPPTGLEDLRVLLIDDNELTRRMMGRVLRAFGIIQICDASDGREALETAHLYFCPNVIVTDWDMKSMDGLTFVSELRMTQPSSANVPVVMISVRTGEAAIRTAKDAGIDEYLPKPIDPAALYNVLVCAPGQMGQEQVSLSPSAPAHP